MKNVSVHLSPFVQRSYCENNAAPKRLDDGSTNPLCELLQHLVPIAHRCKCSNSPFFARIGGFLGVFVNEFNERVNLCLDHLDLIILLLPRHHHYRRRRCALHAHLNNSLLHVHKFKINFVLLFLFLLFNMNITRESF